MEYEIIGKTVYGTNNGHLDAMVTIIDGRVVVSLNGIPQQVADMIPARTTYYRDEAWKAVMNAQVIFNLLPPPPFEPEVLEPEIPIETAVELDGEWPEVEEVPEMDEEWINI